MDGIGHGTTLAGRYRLEDPLPGGRGAGMWRAVDQVLDRPVGVRLVGGAAAADTLDAARRAALVEDPRLLRVLDVGTGDPGLTYVVSELVGGETLADRLRHGPIPPSEARRVVGEAAQALERGDSAGLHHGRLTPAAVLVTRDGGVKVAGLGVDAAVDAGPGSGGAAAGADGAAASRTDAVALVAVLYAGLTGRWPLPLPPGAEVDGLAAAPRVIGQPVPPGDLVPGVPADLDTLCATTFGIPEDGPRTPGELAGRLAPWGFEDTGLAPEAHRTSPDTGLAHEGAGAAGAATPASRPGTTRPPATGGTPAAAPRTRPPGRFPVRLGAAAGTVGAAAAAAATAAGMRPDRDAPTTGWPMSPGTAPIDVGTAPPPGDLPGWGRGDDEERGDSGGRGPRRDQAKVVLVVVAAVVAVVLALALNSLAGVFGGDDESSGDTAAPPSAPASAPPPAPEEGAAPPPPAGPTVQGVRTLDPQGDDGSENDEEAPLAIDGDPGTAWTSSTYESAEFGGLKDGVGLVVDLGRPSAVGGVTLDVRGTGGTVEVQTSGGPSLDGATVVGTADITGAPVDIGFGPVETQFLILWFTRLPDTGDGFRVELARVQLR